MTTLEKISQYLNEYLFDKVWNEPYREYRKNIIPMMLNQRAVVNSIQLRTVRLSMPNKNTEYYLYSIPQIYLGGLRLVVKNWNLLGDWLNQSDLIIRVHGEDGQMLFRNKIYIINHPLEDAIIMAVEKKMFQKVMGLNYDPSKIYFAPYYDSDEINTIRLKFAQITTSGDRSVVFNNIQIDIQESITRSGYDQIIVFVNGRESVISKYDQFKTGDYVEWVIDQNVIGSFDIDLTKDDENRVFYSSLDPERPSYKTIVHIPKAINPDNMILTHNTCDVYVRPKDTRYYTENYRKGLFMHRATEDRGITQLTHNDFSIPNAILDAYKEALNTTEITLHVLVRTHHSDEDHPHPNFLIRDSHYLYLLYQHDDKTILDFMEGIGPEKIGFWEATYLEKNRYVKMMFDTPNEVGVDYIREAIDALGYNHVLSLISPRIFHFTTDTKQNRYDVPIPTLYLGNKIGAILYINGAKIPDEYLSVQRNSDGTMVVMVQEVAYTWADNNVGAAETSPKYAVTFELFEHDDVPVYFIAPSIALDSITLPLPIESYQLYQVKSVDRISSLNGLTTFDRSFELLDQPENKYYTVSDDRKTITFVAQYYGTAFVLVNKRRYFKVPITQQATLRVQINKTPDQKVFTINTIDFEDGDSITQVAVFIKDAQGELVGVDNVPVTIGTKAVTVDLSSDAFIEGIYYVQIYGTTKDNSTFTIEQLGRKVIEINQVCQSYTNLTSGVNMRWPMIKPASYRVFLNGRFLTNNIDYLLVDRTDKNGEYMFTEIVIQSMDYLKPTGNKLEAYAFDDLNYNDLYGFVIGGDLGNANSSPYWLDNISLLAVNGLVMTKYDSTAGIIKVDLTQDEGNIFNIISTIPEDVFEVLGDYKQAEDLERITLLAKYFASIDHTDVEVSVIRGSHKIYSVLTNQLIKDVLEGVKTLYVDPDETRLLEQIQEYMWYKNYDLVFLKELDFRYVDLYPTYRLNETYDPEVYYSLLRTIFAVLPTDPIRDGDTVNEHKQ